MTLFRIASDLHIEHYHDFKSHIFGKYDWNDVTFLPIMENENNQILLLAGDIISIKSRDRQAPFFDKISKRFKHVYICMGNHEFWKSNFITAEYEYDQYLRQWQNITLLEKEGVIIDDVALFGATLWTDLDNASPMAIIAAAQGMPDYSETENFNPTISMFEHKDTLRTLQLFLNAHTDKKKLVMTHHAPSFKSTAPEWVGHALNPCFTSNLENFILNNNIDIWTHGHLHNPVDYMIGSTRIINNPYGYRFRGIENPHFDPFLTIEL